MMGRMKRRHFVKSLAATAFAFQVVPRHVIGQGLVPPSERLNIAGIGIAHQGLTDLAEMQQAGANIVALCDVDWALSAQIINQAPPDRRFKDYRVMLEKRKDIEAVVIATPDHMHAPIAIAAMNAGKHVYVEKPMAHSIEEVRLMTKVAKEKGLVSQMGNMGHGGEGIRLTREWIQAGLIGKVKEVHVWTDRPNRAGSKQQWWSQPVKRPVETPAVPDTLDWDLWLGAAPKRPFHPAYHPFLWRGWFDYGTGALGDMAVHNADPAFYALDLGAPISAESQTSPLGDETYPAWQIITFEFPAKGDRPAVKLVWYDGSKMPPRPELMDKDDELPDNGIYFIGDKGAMVCGGWSGDPRLLPTSRMKETILPAKTIPRSIGHRAEFLKACKDKKPADAKAGFDYSGPFTEALLVGNLSSRLGKKILWDSANMKATNAPEADALIRKQYRAGFGIV